MQEENGSRSLLGLAWERLPWFLKQPDSTIYTRSNDYVVIDFETSNLDKGDPDNRDNSIVLGAWCGSSGDVHMARGNSTDFDILLDRVERSDFTVAHGAKFELGWLARCGVDIARILPWCTLIAEYVEAGNRQWDLSLSAALVRHGLEGKDSLVSGLIKAGVCPTEIPESWVAEYCMRDVQQTHQLFLKQRELLREKGKLGLQYTKCLLTPVLVDLEARGLHLDKARIDTVHDETMSTKNVFEVEMNALTGGLNVRSSQQKAKYIFETLGFAIPKDYKGRPIITEKSLLPKTDKKTLSLLKPKTKIQKRFVEVLTALSAKKQALSKYLIKMKTCSDAGGILKGSIGQTFTQTHRLQSNGRKYKIQLHNIPREYKRLFSARSDNWRIGEADYSGLEFTGAAQLGKDLRAIEDIRSGFDIHSFTAGIIFRYAWEQADAATKQGIRQDAKPYTFKPLYGGQSGTPSEQAYFEEFRRRYPGISRTQEGWRNQVLRTGQLRLPTGLEFFWPDTKITNGGYITNTTKIFNYPIQYLSTGEIVPIGVVYQWHLMRAANLQSFMTDTVHDSTISEIHPDEEEEFSLLTKTALTQLVPWYLEKVYGIKMLLDLDVKIKLDYHWGSE